MNRPRRYALAAVTTAAGAAVALLVTGWGTAVAANISSVFVTNDSSHAIPVAQQGTAEVNVTNTTVPVHEQGTVMTHPATPNAFSLRSHSAFPLDDCSPNLPAGTTWHISSLSFANVAPVSQTVEFFITDGIGSAGWARNDCSGRRHASADVSAAVHADCSGGGLVLHRLG